MEENRQNTLINTEYKISRHCTVQQNESKWKIEQVETCYIYLHIALKKTERLTSEVNRKRK